MPNLGMNVIPWHSLASLLLYQSFLGWQKFHQLIRCDPERSHWPEKSNIFWLDFQIKIFEPIKYQFLWSNMVLTSGAKIQMASRYSSKVTNC